MAAAAFLAGLQEPTRYYYNVMLHDRDPRPSEVRLAIIWEKTAEKALELIRSGIYFPLIEHDSSNLTATIQNIPNRELVKELVARADFATINYVDDQNRNALKAAAQLGDADILDLLLTNGADPNVSGKNGETALFDAILLHNRFSWDTETGKFSSVKLSTEIIFQRVLDSAKMLIKHGASLDLVNDQKKTALQLYVDQRLEEQIDPKLVTFMIGAGAQPVLIKSTISSEIASKLKTATEEGLVLLAANEAEKKALATAILTNTLQHQLPVVKVVIDYI